jgi:molybdopterin molybdotransferase
LAVELSASIEEIVSFKNNLENSLKSIDMLITVGGVENSKENLIFTTLTQKGAQLKKVPVAIGAGHHIIIGSKDSVPVIGIPGHHVASLLIAPLFLIPVIDSMLGINEKTKKKIFAILTRDLDEYDKKTDFLYGKMIRKENGELSVSPISAQDSLMISVLTETECMILVDKNLKLKAGSTVEIIMLTGSHTST